MRLKELVGRPPARPWEAGGKIPWHEPAFSERMLSEHLVPDRDRASRRLPTIDHHVTRTHGAALDRRPARVLDLGCWPGFYSSRLARLGHECVGVDVSPASIAHARAEAERDGLAREYRHEDVRDGGFGEGFDAALMLLGELNTFPLEEARLVLREARRALRTGGRLVLELTTAVQVAVRGRGGREWHADERSVLADAPHGWLRECSWHPAERASVDASTWWCSARRR